MSDLDEMTFTNEHYSYSGLSIISISSLCFFMTGAYNTSASSSFISATFFSIGAYCGSEWVAAFSAPFLTIGAY